MVGGPCSAVSASPWAGPPGTGAVASEAPGRPPWCRVSPRTGPRTISSTGALLHVAPSRGRAVPAEAGPWLAGKRLPQHYRKERFSEGGDCPAALVSAYQPVAPSVRRTYAM